MDVVSLTAAAVVCVVMVVAAIAKLRDLDAFGSALIDFRVPRLLVVPIMWLTPVAELAIAGGLLFAPTRPTASAAAVVLLLVFAVLLGTSLRGRQPVNCACFGFALFSTRNSAPDR